MKDNGIPVDTVMFDSLSGRLRDRVVEQVTEWHADLVVLGTHGRRGLKRALPGSDPSRPCGPRPCRCCWYVRPRRRRWRTRHRQRVRREQKAAERQLHAATVAGWRACLEMTPPSPPAINAVTSTMIGASARPPGDARSSGVHSGSNLAL